MIVAIVLIGIAGLLAYANGANDVSKGIATLVGSGVTDYRRAMAWGAMWTGAGAVLATFVTGAMLATFGSGLLTSGAAPTVPMAVASIGGASACVLLATRFGLPVSTTHAIVGAIVGAALAAYGSTHIAWSVLGARVALPLAASPIVAMSASWLILRGVGRVMGPATSSADCVCMTANVQPAAVIAPAAVLSYATPAMDVAVSYGHADDCAQAHPAAWRLTGDHLHWLSSGAVSFARGLNDTPKIVALVLAVAALMPARRIAPWHLFGVVAFAMVAGSLLAGRRVTKFLAEDVTSMTHRDGLTANVVTAALVVAGAVHGLPMSTTHVASGGIIGAGVDRGSIVWDTARKMALAWVITVPAAALLAVVIYALTTATGAHWLALGARG
ncbi:MAG: inorganic phosphate transporter [Acidobacteria bacterium]|nr:inorganic phosphate transporter [Acidobacteriota bacterium]